MGLLFSPTKIGKSKNTEKVLTLRRLKNEAGKNSKTRGLKFTNLQKQQATSSTRNAAGDQAAGDKGTGTSELDLGTRVKPKCDQSASR